MKIRSFIFFATMFFASFHSLNAQGFLHASGTKIVDGNGANYILKGMGLGGCMVQEPYMMLVSASAPAGQHSIFADIEALIGKEKLNTYQQAWLKNYFSEDDVIAMKAAGFNSIRLPMHYNLYTLPIEDEPIQGQDTWLQTGFELTDSILKWCKKYELYLILDLHAAPGGQGLDGNISDYDNSKPSLWDSPENKRKTIALWGKLAERYANETWIGGYDLINETNWKFDGSNSNGCNDNINAPLKSLMNDMVKEVRKFDANHLIFVEGNCWAKNHKGLWSFDDSNIALSFHKYWDSNVLSSIQGYLNLSNQYNVPLWMGESGENTDKWYTDAVVLLEENNIGWAWWSWKKMESNSGSYSIKKPAAYQTLISYWKSGGTKPDTAAAFNAMMQLAENAKIQNCVRNNTAISALFTGKEDCSTKQAVLVPATIQAENYCSMFGVQAETTLDINGGEDVGYLDSNDWISWNIDVPEAALYTVSYRVASLNGGAKFQIENFGTSSVYGLMDVPKTDGWQTWATISHDVALSTGKQTLRLLVNAAGCNINWLSIEKSNSIYANNPNVVGEPFIVSPNPTADYFTVSNVEKIYRVEVLDLLGQQVMVFTNKEEFSNMNMSALPNGLYVVNIIDVHYLSANRILVKK